MFFRKFETIQYSIDGYSKNAKNILKAVLPKFNNINSTFVFQKYTVMSGQRPESVAYEIYNNADYYWTVLIINNIVNPFTDWPMSDEEVELYALRKYGPDSLYTIHHFFWLDTGKWLDEVSDSEQRLIYPNNPQNIIPVTNLKYEMDLNTEKRSIIVINPKYIQKFIESYNLALEGKE